MATPVFTFLRHAESLYNCDQSQDVDVALSELGVKQASVLSGAYDYILVSPLARARQTLRLSQLSAPHVEVSTLCREKLQSDIVSNSMDGESGLDESLIQFVMRVQLLTAYLKQLAQRYKRILVISHMGVITALTGKEPDNAESIDVTHLLSPEELVAVAINHT
jgi:broad specificity phosphatase PhoE